MNQGASSNFSVSNLEKSIFIFRINVHISHFLVICNAWIRCIFGNLSFAHCNTPLYLYLSTVAQWKLYLLPAQVARWKALHKYKAGELLTLGNKSR